MSRGERGEEKGGVVMDGVGMIVEGVATEGVASEGEGLSLGERMGVVTDEGVVVTSVLRVWSRKKTHEVGVREEGRGREGKGEIGKRREGKRGRGGKGGRREGRDRGKRKVVRDGERGS